MARYVVAGATGRVGSRVATKLLGRGEVVTVIVRDDGRGPDWARRGAHVARGSLADRSFLTNVLDGASGFFTLLPENVPPNDFHGARRRMADTISGAVQDSGVAQVVMLSAIAAALPDGNGPAKDLHYFEQALVASTKQLTVLRAGYFQDNVAGVIPAAVHAGIYPNFFASADAPVPMIATRDVARFAAEALPAASRDREIIDVLGPAYSVRQVASALGAALGRDLQVVDVPAARHSDTLVEAGIPRPLADAMAEMFAAFNTGLIAPRGDRQLYGTTSIDTVIAQYVRGAAQTTG